VGIDKVEELEITLCVVDDAVEIVDLKQAQVAVIILNAFLLKLAHCSAVSSKVSPRASARAHEVDDT